MRDQIQRLGSLYDWDKEVAAHDKIITDGHNIFYTIIQQWTGL